jgi:hypothetical protein
MIGRRFGRLLVIERVPPVDRYARFRCQCDCGALTEVRGSHLRAGKTRSCGCFRQRGVEIGAATAIDMVGKVIGRLTVLERVGSEQTKGDASLAIWRRRCSCGNVKDVAGHHLRRGSVKSCGCLRRELGRSKLAALRKR